jgi:hypothetical protein
MHTFAKKPNVRQPAASASSMFGRTHPRQNHEHLAPRADAAQRHTEANTATSEAETTAPSLDWNFSAVPVHAPVPARLQTKLELGMPGDVHEQEADRVAEQVMRMPEPKGRSKAPADISGHTTAPAALVQTKSTHPGDNGGAAAPPIVDDVLRSPGQPLDAATRAFMEPRLGQDFGHVRVHTDTKAAESAAAINARAFAANHHVVLGAGEYAPQTGSGRRLLSHELTHVAQGTRGEGNAGAVIHRQPVANAPDKAADDKSSSKDGKSQDEDGRQLVWRLVAALLHKSYPKPAKPAAGNSPSTTEGQAAADEIADYDAAAIKDCSDLLSSMSAEGAAYLNSAAGKVLLDSFNKSVPEGHALRLVAARWQMSTSPVARPTTGKSDPEPLPTRSEYRDKKQSAKLEDLLGVKLGKQAYAMASDKNMGSAVKSGASLGVNAFIKSEEKRIAAKVIGPDYTSQNAKEDKADLEKIKTLIGEMEDDVLQTYRFKRIFEIFRPVVTNRVILEGVLLALFDPSSVKAAPGFDASNTPAGNFIKEFMSTEAAQSGSVPFSKSIKGTKIEGKLGIGTNKFTPNKVLDGTEDAFAALKNVENEIKVSFGGDANKTWIVNLKNGYMFPAPNPAAADAGGSLKGSAELDFANKLNKKSFAGKTDYEFKQDTSNVNASQKFTGGDDYALFSEGYKSDKSGSTTSIGAEIKNAMFKETLVLNLPRNPAGLPAGETAKIALGIDPKKDKTKSLSFDANIVMNLAGQDHVKSFASFLGYKDPKHFVEICLGYQYEHTGSVQKDDLSLALKKTWNKFSIYSGTSLGFTGGKPERGEAMVGAEWKTGETALLGDDKKAKPYGLYSQATYGQSGLPGSHDKLAAEFGLTYNKSRLGFYVSDLKADQFGIKYSLIFNPSKYKR